jgi:hypothetical protein
MTGDRPPVQRVPDRKKLGANTTSRSSGRKDKSISDAPSLEQFQQMSEKELFNWYKDRGLIS